MAERKSFNENGSINSWIFIKVCRVFIHTDPGVAVETSCCGLQLRQLRCRHRFRCVSNAWRTTRSQRARSTTGFEKAHPRKPWSKGIKKLVIWQVLIFQQNKTSFGGGRGWGGFNKRLAIFVHEHVLKPLHLVGHIWLCPFSLKFLKQRIKQIKCPWRALCWPKRPFKGQRWRHRSWLLGEIWREKYFPNWGSLFR